MITEDKVDNDVFKFRCKLKWDFTEEDITVYTKPFPDVVFTT